MRLYIIGFMVGVMGLVAANQVRAEEGGGLGSDTVSKVARWQTEKERNGMMLTFFGLVSQDSKPVRDASGSVEIMSNGRRILSPPIALSKPAERSIGFPLEYKARNLALAGSDVIACVAADTYADGSGVIIN